VSLRLFSVYGERERPDKLYHKLIHAITEGREFPLHEGSRDHVRSYSYVGDVINGMIATLEARDRVIGEIINLGTDVTHTTGEGIDLIEELLGQKAKFIMHPPRPGDQKETVADISKARSLLGYAPQASLREGLSNQVSWYKARREGK
jgi:nucleoside-diphosphate-sugar epimerase